MHPPTSLPTNQPAAAERRAPGAAFGFLLLAPAALAAVLCLLLPTGYVIVTSLRGSGLLRPGPFVGLTNYLLMLGDGLFWRSLGGSVLLVFLPALALFTIVPMLGTMLDRAGTWPRLAGRIALSLPLAAYSPVALARAWDVPVTALTFPVVVGASVFGLVTGLGLIVALAVLRGRGRGRSAAAAVAVIAALALVAAGLQAFTFPRTLPGGFGWSLAEMQFNAAFVRLQVGYGAAVATVTGLLLAALGVAAVLVAIRARLRIELLPRSSAGAGATAARGGGGPAGGGSPAGGGGSAGGGGLRTAVAVTALVIVALGVIVTQLPWLIDLVAPAPRPRGPRIEYPELRLQAATWLPPLLSSIVAVGVALVAAIGIGGLRPLGRRSEWLLLPFAPWLFVGIGPLAFAFFQFARELGLIGTVAGLIPPTLLSVPALVVLTLLCRGQAARWLARPAPSMPDFFSIVVLPALPLAGLLIVANTLVGAQGLLWQQVASPRPVTATVLLARSSPFGNLVDLSATPWVVVLALLAILVVAQIWYLDRIAIGAGDGVPSDPSVPTDASIPGVPTVPAGRRPYDYPPQGRPPQAGPPHERPPQDRATQDRPPQDHRPQDQRPPSTDSGGD
jgi:hypothetical protein